MHLVNFPPVRIKHYPGKGYVPEIQKKTWYGRKYWTHIVPVSGIPDEPWYFSTPLSVIEHTPNIFRMHLLCHNDWFGVKRQEKQTENDAENQE